MCKTNQIKSIIKGLDLERSQFLLKDTSTGWIHVSILCTRSNFPIITSQVKFTMIVLVKNLATVQLHGNRILDAVIV